MKTNKEYTIIYQRGLNHGKESIKIKKINKNNFVIDNYYNKINIQNLTHFKNIHKECVNCKKFSICAKQTIFNNIKFSWSPRIEKIMTSIIIEYLNDSSICKENKNVEKSCGKIFSTNFFAIYDNETKTKIFQKGIE